MVFALHMSPAILNESRTVVELAKRRLAVPAKALTSKGTAPMMPMTFNAVSRRPVALQKDLASA